MNCPYCESNKLESTGKYINGKLFIRCLSCDRVFVPDKKDYSKGGELVYLKLSERVGCLEATLNHILKKLSKKLVLTEYEKGQMDTIRIVLELLGRVHK